MTRLFHLYGGKKGYLTATEAKHFIRDVLIVCELLDEIDDVESTINGIFIELDSSGTNKLFLSELLKPSWGKVQDILHTVASKMNKLNSSTNGFGTPPHPSGTTSLPNAKIYEESLSQSDIENNCPPSFICPISTEIMSDPVILVETGTTYDRKSIQQWLEKHDSDPSTGLKVTSKELISVLSLKNAIEEWTENRKTKQKERKVRRQITEIKVSEKKEKGSRKKPPSLPDISNRSGSSDILQLTDYLKKDNIDEISQNEHHGPRSTSGESNEYGSTTSGEPSNDRNTADPLQPYN
jgi:hypothetical protein